MHVAGEAGGEGGGRNYLGGRMGAVNALRWCTGDAEEHATGEAWDLLAVSFGTMCCVHGMVWGWSKALNRPCRSRLLTGPVSSQESPTACAHVHTLATAAATG